MSLSRREPRPPRRRRTVLVTFRWVASAAVIASMTAGAAEATGDDEPTSSEIAGDTSSATDPAD